MNPFSLAGKHIVISGASSGIGRQCAISCAAMGAKISLLGRNQERLEKTLLAMEGEGHKFFVLDLTVEVDVKNSVQQIVSQCGSIDGLLNVAGISITLPLKLISEKKLNEFFRANVFSSIMLTREVCKLGIISSEGEALFSSLLLWGRTEMLASHYTL